MKVLAAIIVAGIAATATATPLRGVGLDTFDLFQAYVNQTPTNRSFAVESMRSACSERNLTILRVAATGFWPDDLKQYLDDPSTWWAAFRTFLDDAERYSCRLLLDLFWNFFSLPDLAAEPLRYALTDPSSDTRRLQTAYAVQAVTIAGKSPAVVAWELANEMNLVQDLDLSKHQPSIAPSRGTPKQRTRADNISTADAVQWGQALATVIRAVDPLGRPISSGHAIPRPAAFHLAQSYPKGFEDFTPDNETEFSLALTQAAEPYDLMSVHLYAHGGENIRFNSTPVGPYDTSLLGLVQQTARAAGKQALLGEFGDPLPGSRPWTHSVLQALGNGADQIDLALVWVYRFHQRSAGVPANFSLELGRDEAALQAIAETNAAIVQS